MLNIIKFLGFIGIYTIWITPLTLVTGIIYAIKKPENEATPYKITAIVSAYLIINAILFTIMSTT